MRISELDELIAGHDAAPQRRTLRAHLKWAALVIAALCLGVLVRFIDPHALAADLKQADAAWLALAAGANFLVLPLMTAQWRRLLPRANRARCATLWEAVTISMAGMNTLPFGGGHALAVGLLTTRKVTTISGAISLLALEQVCEGVARTGLLLIALVLAPVPAVFSRAGVSFVIGVVILFAVLLFLGRARPDAVAGPRWRAKPSAHLEALRRPRALLAGIALSVAMKLCGIAAVWAVQRSLGAGLSLGDACVVFAAVTFGTGIALSPGNVGTFELAAVGAYHLLGVTGETPVTIALLLHVCFLVPIVGTGWIVGIRRAAISARVEAANGTTAGS